MCPCCALLGDALPGIHGLSVKTFICSGWQHTADGKRTASLVSTTDEAHFVMRRPIASAYSLSAIVEIEPLIDSMTAVFLSSLDGLFAETVVEPAICGPGYSGTLSM